MVSISKTTVVKSSKLCVIVGQYPQNYSGYGIQTLSDNKSWP